MRDVTDFCNRRDWAAQREGVRKGGFAAVCGANSVILKRICLKTAHAGRMKDGAENCWAMEM